jgi:hypothetical protein
MLRAPAGFMHEVQKGDPSAAGPSAQLRALVEEGCISTLPRALIEGKANTTDFGAPCACMPYARLADSACLCARSVPMCSLQAATLCDRTRL